MAGLGASTTVVGRKIYLFVSIHFHLKCPIHAHFCPGSTPGSERLADRYVFDMESFGSWECIQVVTHPDDHIPLLVREVGQKPPNLQGS